MYMHHHNNFPHLYRCQSHIRELSPCHYFTCTSYETVQLILIHFKQYYNDMNLCCII